MHLRKIIKSILSITIMTPIITLPNACANTMNDINYNVAKALHLYDKNGNSLINQYITYQDDNLTPNSTPYKIAVGTDQFNMNTAPNFDKNNLFRIRNQDYRNYPQIKAFLHKILHLPLTKNGDININYLGDISIKVIENSYNIPTNTILGINKNGDIDLQVKATTCVLNFYNNKTNKSLANYRLQVSSSFLNLYQKPILINQKDVLVGYENYHDKNWNETGFSINQVLRLKTYDLGTKTKDLIALSKLLNLKISFRIYDIDGQHLVRNDEQVKFSTNYGVALLLNDVFVNVAITLGQR